MNKKVMDALEAVADEVTGQDGNFRNSLLNEVTVDADNLKTLLEWALGQRIHLQFGEEVGLTVYEEEDEGFDPEDCQPAKGVIVGFSGRDGVLVEVENHVGPLYYERKDVHTL